MDSLLYKTPSPVTAKRRLSSVPATRTGIGRQEIAVSEQVERIQRDWPELLIDEGIRRASLSNSNEFLKHLKEEKDIGDSSMGFKELERHIAKIKRQNFDLKLELHIRREKMTANAEKIHKAEQLVQENEELRERMQEICMTLKTKVDELADSKSLIRLLSDQLEQAHKRIASLTDSPSRTIQTNETPTSTRVEQSLHTTKKSPKMQESYLPGSPSSIVSIESSLAGGHSEDEEMMEIDTSDERARETFHQQKQPPSPPKKSIESIKPIHIPLILEHSPKTIRRQSMLDQLSPPPSSTTNRAPYYNNNSDRARQSQIPSKRNYNLIYPESQQPSKRNSKQTPDPSRIIITNTNTEIPKSVLPPTPEDTPVLVKAPSQRGGGGPLTLRGRIFRSKSDLLDLKKAEQPPSPTALEPTNSIVKRSSLIKFWKSKTSNKKDESSKKPTAKEIFFEPSPPPRQEFTAPHEADKLSRYPKVRPMSTQTSPPRTTIPSNPEWRHSIGRQVSELVQHWEQESTKRISETRRSSTGGTEILSSKRLSSIIAGPLAVKAARDAWTTKTTGNGSSGGLSGSFSRSSSLRSCAGDAGGDHFRRKREPVGRRIGLLFSRDC